jgi:hypothetical protein
MDIVQSLQSANWKLKKLFKLKLEESEGERPKTGRLTVVYLNGLRLIFMLSNGS